MLRPLLAKHGLVIFQNAAGTLQKRSTSTGTGEEDGYREVESYGTISMSTTILHVSGEWLESDELSVSPERATAQGAGSVITYLRRYQMDAVLGITGETDDDANSDETHVLGSPAPRKASNPDATISEAQVKLLNVVCSLGNADTHKVAESYGTDSIKNLTKGQMDEVITSLESSGRIVKNSAGRYEAPVPEDNDTFIPDFDLDES
jgi:hypothetical protein